MKTVGAIYFAVAIFFITSSADAKMCASLFQERSPSDFTKMYNAEAKRLQKEGLNLSTPYESENVLAKSKVEFIRQNRSHLENLISQGEVSLQDVIKAQVYEAETVRGNASQSRSHVVVLNDKFYSFDPQGKSYRVLGENKVGFNKISIVEYMRLGKEHSLLILNDKVFAFPLAEKDPTQLAKTIEAGKDIPPHIAEIYKTNKKELESILIETPITIAELMSATYLKTTSEKGKTVHFLTLPVLEGSIVAYKGIYLTSEPGIVETSKNRKWGMLSLSPNVGFSENTSVRLKTEENTTIAVERGQLIFSREARALKLFMTLTSIIDDSKMSNFRFQFIQRYGKEVIRLIEEDYFSQNNFHIVMAKLDLVISERGHKLYTLPSRAGDLFFKVDGTGMGRLAELPVAEYGKTFYSASLQEMIVIGRQIGFLSKTEAKRIETQNPELNSEAFYAKIEVAVGRELTNKSRNGLERASEKIEEKGPLYELPPRALVKTMATFKTDLVKSGFSKKEADEVIKILFPNL